MIRSWPIAFGLVGLSLGVAGTASAADDMFVQLMASRVSAINGEFTGHAFLCVQLLLTSGIKEDCYGFYPKVDNIKGFIGGPGVVQSEFQENPNRFSRIDQSLQVPITANQRRAILQLVDEWNQADYSLAKQQCVDFIRSVAAAAGLTVPARSISDFPVDFLKKLKDSNPQVLNNNRRSAAKQRQQK